MTKARTVGAMYLLVAVWVGLLAGCPTRPNPNAADLTCNDETHVCVGMLKIASPVTPVYTNGTVTIQVTAAPENNPPPAVDFQVDDMLLATVPPPFKYMWDTALAVQGQHQVRATATIAGTTISSDPVTIWVDRTPPTVSARMPAQNATNVALSDGVRITFSEPLDPSSISDASVTLSSGGTTLVTSATLDVDGQTIDVALHPQAISSFPATITAAVSTSVKDLAGNAVGTLSSWAWAAPLWVKMPSLPASWGYVALDPSGQPNLTYLTDTGAARGHWP